jgi:hypothetical protein
MRCYNYIDRRAIPAHSAAEGTEPLENAAYAACKETNPWD